MFAVAPKELRHKVNENVVALIFLGYDLSDSHFQGWKPSLPPSKGIV